MFTRIYYDYQKNKIYCVEKENGKRSVIEEHIKHEFYIPDKTGKSTQKDIYGNPVSLQSVDTKESMEVYKTATKTCETDISPDIKFLQKRYFGKNLLANIKDFQIATIDIEVESEKESPKPEFAKYPINLISVHYSQEDEIYTYGIRPYTGNHPTVKNYHYCADEKTMIEKFIYDFRKKKADILTGWFIKLFDVPYIINRSKRLGIEISLSPLNIVQEKKFGGGGKKVKGGGYTIAGISILDGFDLFKQFERGNYESYSLQNIGMAVVGEGKKDYEGTINNAWKVDWNAFVEYNVQDVILTKKIEDKKKYLKLAIDFCYQALIPFERIFSSISLITGYITKYLHERNMVLPDRPNSEKKDKFPGAFVMAKRNLWKYLISFDIESMYPHMIMMYNISPETLVLNPSDPENYQKTPLSEYKTWDTAKGPFEIGGVYYRKDKIGVLASLIKDIFNDRKMFKDKKKIATAIVNNSSLEKFNKTFVEEVINENGTPEYYDSMQYIRKILINSMYGVLGNQYFNFFNVNNAIAVTLSGQELIKYLSNTLNEYCKANWHKIAPKIFPNVKDIKPLKKDVIVLVDTDSNYICMDEMITSLGIKFNSNKEFREFVYKMEKVFFKPFFVKILDKYAKKYDVENIINFKREKIIKQKFILAKKKYVDQVIEDADGNIFDDEPEIDSTGVEIIRTDTPIFCRNRIGGILQKIFDSEGNINKKREIVENMKQIKLDFIKEHPTNVAIPTGVQDYQKYALPVEEYLQKGLYYPKHCPIHVRASINYNYIIEKEKLPLTPINNGTKMKYLYVLPKKNELYQNIIGFVGQWPNEFNKKFDIDYDRQWETAFQSIIQRFFDVINWGQISFENVDMGGFLDFEECSISTVVETGDNIEYEEEENEFEDESLDDF